MTEDELFATPALRVLEPPPGGLDRVRATLDRRRPRWWLLAIPAVAVAVIVAIVFVGRARGPSRAPLATTQAAPVTPLVADPTIAANDDVSFYWVASRAQPANQTVRGVTLEAVDAVGQPPTVLIP
jgi:hypothetical protein